MTFPNSEAQVVSTIAMVLEKFLYILKEEVPGIQFVYDESLSFETALATLRANNNEAGEKSGAYPLFIFRRSVLRYCKDGPGKRSITNRARGVQSAGKVPIYRTVHGEFDVEFFYVAKTMEQLERFEIAYLAEESFSEDRELVVDLTPQIGSPMSYYLSPSPLSDKRVQSEGVYYKGATGSLTIRGFYLVFREQLKHINSMGIRILEFNQNVLTQGEIP